MLKGRTGTDDDEVAALGSHERRKLGPGVVLLGVEGLEETIILPPSVLHANDACFELIAFYFCAFYAFLALENEKLDVV